MYKKWRVSCCIAGVIFASVLVACHNTENISSDSGKAPSSVITDKHEIKNLLESLPPETMLVRPLNDAVGKKQLLIVCFAEHSGQELMFVPAPYLEEVNKYLQDYYEQYPDSKKLQMVSVGEEDWKKVLRKAASVTGSEQKRNKNFASSNVKKLAENNSDGGISHFTTYIKYDGWTRLKEKLLKNAIHNIPPSKNELGDGGLNSAAKAINMVGQTMNKRTYMTTFLDEAPSSFGQVAKKVGHTGVIVSRGAALAGVLAAPFTGGLSLVGTAGFLGASLIPDLIPADVGPSPGQLAKYITQHLGTGSAVYESSNDFDKCAAIIQEDLEEKKPVIVFWSFSASIARYVNVVGVLPGESGQPTEFVVMDPDSCLYHLKRQNMEDLMRRESISYALVSTSRDKFHMIRFKDTGRKKRNSWRGFFRSNN